MIAGTLAKVSTLLMTVGLPHRPLLGRIRRPDARLAALALDRVDQRRLLAADEGPGAEADLQVEVEAGAEDVLAQQPALAALVDGVLDPLDGQRVLGADVEEALVRADGVAADDHPLDDVERIALEHAAVHERAGVALVGVADDVVGSCRRPRAHRPLLAGRKAAAAAAAELRPR